MKVVQTTEFEVLGPLEDENAGKIMDRVQKHTGQRYSVPPEFVTVGFYILLGDDHTARPVHPADMQANYETTDGNTLDRLEEEFDLSTFAQQGELHTEEVWQCWQKFPSDDEGGWWDAMDESNARERTTHGQVRMRRDITVNGPWKYFEVKS